MMKFFWPGTYLYFRHLLHSAGTALAPCRRAGRAHAAAHPLLAVPCWWSRTPTCTCPLSPACPHPSHPLSSSRAPSPPPSRRARIRRLRSAPHGSKTTAGSAASSAPSPPEESSREARRRRGRPRLCPPRPLAARNKVRRFSVHPAAVEHPRAPG